MTPRDWLQEKMKQYKARTGEVWDFVDPYSDHPLASYCSETLMRMGVEKRYFGLTSPQENLEIANAIMIRERIT